MKTKRDQGIEGPRDRGIPRPAARGFTLAELMVVVVLIAVISTLAFVVLGRALRDSRRSLERQTVVAMRNAVESFQQDFKFLPPLVNDGGGAITPIDPMTRNPRIRNDAFLESAVEPNSKRYSVYSLSYYIFGFMNTREDGVDGPGYTEPLPDGSFTRRGREFGPRLDINKDPTRIKRDAHWQDNGEIAYVDRWGKVTTSGNGWPPVNPIRYYRWKPVFGNDGLVGEYLVPAAVGDPNKDHALRDATFAIVSIGPDGFTDELRPLPINRIGGSPFPTRVQPQGSQINTRVTEDDIVEVGR